MIITAMGKPGERMAMTPSTNTLSSNRLPAKQADAKLDGKAAADGKPSAAVKMASQAGVGNSLFLAVKHQMDELTHEVTAIRETIHEDSSREDALINERLTYFDEFKL